MPIIIITLKLSVKCQEICGYIFFFNVFDPFHLRQRQILNAILCKGISICKIYFVVLLDKNSALEFKGVGKNTIIGTIRAEKREVYTHARVTVAGPSTACAATRYIIRGGGSC